MALKDKWTDKIDGVDDVLSEHINDVAHGVIELEEKQKYEAEPNSAAIRGSSGQLKVATPIENDDSVNLKFFKEKASNALIGEKVGNSIVFDDISLVPATVKVSVESKNLVPAAYHDNRSGNTVTIKGVTLTTNEDGSITLYGTPDENTYISFFLVSSKDNPLVLPKGTYFGSTGVDFATLSYMQLNGTYGNFNGAETLLEETKMQYLYVSMLERNIAGKTFNGETIYPMLVRGEGGKEYVQPLAAGTKVSIVLSFTDQPIESAVGETIEIDVPSKDDGVNIFNDGALLYVEYNKDINDAFSELKTEFETQMGDIETALDAIIAIQDNLRGV